MGNEHKEQYSRLLKLPQWKAKRQLILDRDKSACTHCGDTKKLHVHHRYYLSGKLPWEYPNEALQTLCAPCHRKEHKIKDISEFTKKKANKKHHVPKQKPQKKKKKKAAPPNHKQRVILNIKERINKFDEKTAARRDEKRTQSRTYNLPEYKHLLNRVS